MNPSPYSLSQIERPLYLQLLILALVSLVIGSVCGGWTWGASAAIGVCTAIVYYAMLGVQVRRQLGSGRKPNMLMAIVSFLGRQAICLLAPTLCFVFLGPAWWMSMVTLVVARHWVLVVAWSQNRAPLPAPQA